jgi:putative acetyltransferase
MQIRSETEADHASIRGIHLAAFADHPHSQQTEHLIVAALRSAKALSLSLVAEVNGNVVGHLAFSPVWIEEQDRGWFILGPVGVLPEFQRQGIGQRLIQAGLQMLRERGAGGCVLVGSPAYYCRFGFRRIPELVLEGFPRENFLSLPMTERIPCGRVTYHSAFSVHA